MRTFLQLALSDVLFLMALGTIGALYNGSIHLAGVVAIVAVLAVFGIAACNALRIAWRGAGDTSHLNLAVAVCPMIAMLGTVSGFLIAFSGGSGDVQERVLGASTGLASTFVGVACSILLMGQEHLLRSQDVNKSGCSCR